MTKRLIDVDDDLLGAARDALGAGTMKDTVNAALRAVTDMELRRRHVARLHADGLPDLRSAEVMGGAWR